MSADVMSAVVIHHPGSGMNTRGSRTMATIFGMLAVAVMEYAAITTLWSVLTGVPPLLTVPLTHWLTARRTYRADATGIHARFMMNEPWERIASVKVPTQWDEFTMVRMRGTGEERRTGFPTSYAEQLAAIGNKPLV